MGKSFGILVATVTVIIALVSAGVLWVGPELVNLALFDSQRHQPYALLSFTRGQSAEVYKVRYQQPLAGLIASESGELLAGYRLSALLEGATADEWDYLNQLQVGHARDLVQVMTSAPYRLIHNPTPAFQDMQIGSYKLPQNDWQSAVAVWLVETRGGSALDPLEAVVAQLKLGNGRVVWNTAVTPLEGEGTWDRIFVVDFATEVLAYAWLGDIEVETARSLANAEVRRLALAVYVRE